jgi:hypothetical protein
MIVESSAVNAIGYLLFLIPTAIGSDIAYLFSPALGEVQVRLVITFFRRTAIV